MWFTNKIIFVLMYTMYKTKSWTEQNLIEAVKNSSSIRRVLKLLNLRPTGGNYKQIQKYLFIYKISIDHFTGKLWNKGKKIPFKAKIPLNKILTINNNFQSYKLKNRLFKAGLKKPICDLCGWCQKSDDGRIPVEIDHINGMANDNRLENLRILCPNCHSLQPTHRAKNIKMR